MLKTRYAATLTAVAKQLNQHMARDSWVTDNSLRASLIQQYRDYYDGTHQGFITPEIAKLLRVAEWSDEMPSPFNSNYCPVIVDTMADRLSVANIEADTEAATDWINQLLADNHFDGLQGDIHLATLRDGDTFIFVDWDRDLNRPVFYHELAFTHEHGGIIVLYERSDRDDIKAAIKIWYTTQKEYADTVRFNIYYPDRIEKYIGATTGQGVEMYKDNPSDTWPYAWVDSTGQPLGVPIVVFSNGKTGTKHHGVSELQKVLPLQDILNRHLHSMLANVELAGFSMLKVIGADMQNMAIAPGMILNIGKTPIATQYHLPVADRIEAGDVEGIMRAYWLVKEEIYDITNTPRTDTASANASGEALKQREIGLMGKCRRFQVKIGNSWERVIRIAHRLQMTFGVAATPAIQVLSTNWNSAEVRNVKEGIENIVLVSGIIGQEQTIREIGELLAWTPEKIQQVIDAQVNAQAQDINNLLATLPSFSNRG